MGTLTEWNIFDTDSKINTSARSPLGYFLIFISVLFIGILIFCYVVTRQAHPIFLDEHGKPIIHDSGGAHH